PRLARLDVQSGASQARAWCAGSMTRAEKIALVVVLVVAAFIAAPSVTSRVQERFGPRSVVARNEGPNEAVAFTPDSRWLVTRTFDRLSVHETANGATIARRDDWLGSQDRTVPSVAISPRGDVVASGHTLYSIPTLEPRGTLPGEALAFSSDEDTIAVLTTAVALVSARTGKIRLVLEGTTGLPLPSFSADGLLIACCSTLPNT